MSSKEAEDKIENEETSNKSGESEKYDVEYEDDEIDEDEENKSGYDDESFEDNSEKDSNDSLEREKVSKQNESLMVKEKDLTKSSLGSKSESEENVPDEESESPLTLQPLAFVDSIIKFKAQPTNSSNEILSSFKIQNICDSLILFKVRTTNIKKYQIYPVLGVVEPKNLTSIKVILQENDAYYTIPKDRFEVKIIKYSDLELEIDNEEIEKFSFKGKRRSSEVIESLRNLWNKISEKRQVETHRIDCEIEESTSESASERKESASENDTQKTQNQFKLEKIDSEEYSQFKSIDNTISTLSSLSTSYNNSKSSHNSRSSQEGPSPNVKSKVQSLAESEQSELSEESGHPGQSISENEYEYVASDFPSLVLSSPENILDQTQKKTNVLIKVHNQSIIEQNISKTTNLNVRKKVQFATPLPTKESERNNNNNAQQEIIFNSDLVGGNENRTIIRIRPFFQTYIVNTVRSYLTEIVIFLSIFILFLSIFFIWLLYSKNNNEHRNNNNCNKIHSFDNENIDSDSDCI